MCVSVLWFVPPSRAHLDLPRGTSSQARFTAPLLGCCDQSALRGLVGGFGGFQKCEENTANSEGRPRTRS